MWTAPLKIHEPKLTREEFVSCIGTGKVIQELYPIYGKVIPNLVFLLPKKSLNQKESLILLICVAKLEQPKDQDLIYTQ